MHHTRRDFIKSASAFATTSLMLGQVTHGAEAPALPNKVGAFVKPFPDMPYDRLAETMARLGFDGIEGRWAIRRAGPSFPATTPRASSNIRPAPAARCATARCISTSRFLGRLPRL